MKRFLRAAFSWSWKRFSLLFILVFLYLAFAPQWLMHVLHQKMLAAGIDAVKHRQLNAKFEFEGALASLKVQQRWHPDCVLHVHFDWNGWTAQGCVSAWGSLIMDGHSSAGMWRELTWRHASWHYENAWYRSGSASWQAEQLQHQHVQLKEIKGQAQQQSALWQGKITFKPRWLDAPPDWEALWERPWQGRFQQKKDRLFAQLEAPDAFRLQQDAPWSGGSAWLNGARLWVNQKAVERYGWYAPLQYAYGMGIMPVANGHYDFRVQITPQLKLHKP